MADLHIVSRHVDPAAQQGDAGGGRGLAGNRDVRLVYAQRRSFQIDRTADLEHDDTRPRTGQCFGQRTRSVLGQRGDADDLTALAAIGGVGRLRAHGGGRGQR